MVRHILPCPGTWVSDVAAKQHPPQPNASEQATPSRLTANKSVATSWVALSMLVKPESAFCRPQIAPEAVATAATLASTIRRFPP